MDKNKLSLANLTKAITIIAIVFIVAVIGQTMMFINYDTALQNTFAEGVTINSVNVGRLNKVQAQNKVGTY